MGGRKFLPELSRILECAEGAVFVTADGRNGCGFHLPLIDLESREEEEQGLAMERLIEGLPDGMILRILQNAQLAREVGFESFRSQAVAEIGFVERRVLLTLEQKGQNTRGGGEVWSLGALLRKLWGSGDPPSAQAERVLRGAPQEALRALGARACSRGELEEIFNRADDDQISHELGRIDFGTAVTGVIRIYKPGIHPISCATLAGLLDRIPLPYEVGVTIRKIPRHRADFRLRSQLVRNETMPDPLTSTKQEATERALLDTSIYGASLCEVEWLLILKRRSESELRSDLESARAILGSLGVAMIETVGCVPSFIASRVGADPHFTFLEESGAVPFYLPIFTSGEKDDRQRSTGPRTLLFHRLDGSLHGFDPFNRRFLAHNTLICGKSGSGKSVLAHALSSALLQDPTIEMIKIDVGGSYRRECEALGGTEVSFELNSPSGINPFAALGAVAGSNEAMDAVAEFLATLIREEGESKVPKALRAQVEEHLKRYCAERLSGLGREATLEDFVSRSPDFPRVGLLLRWGKGGVFENALKERPGLPSSGSNRYRYFNFENIQAAANRDYAEGVMAAVITLVNLEMLRLGDRSQGLEGHRLVLFCDETRFFIERFHAFFLLTAANFRKFGHGLVLLFQNIRDAEIITPGGSVDRGLILNSPIRFFLQADTEADYLSRQFELNERQLGAIVTHPYRGREYREAVLQDDLGTRIVRLYLTDEEYWRMTSSREDVEKFNRLRDAVPGLTTEEAIRCLAISNQR